MKITNALFLVALFVATPAAAYELFVTEVTEPYQIVPLESPLEEKQAYVGELVDYPLMYEVTTDATTTLSAQLSQRYRGAMPLGLALMVVRSDDRGGGVTEIGRLHPESADWVKRRDKVYGMTFWDSAIFAREVGPGTYRIEVSTPENQGPYLLTIGTNDKDSGYWKTLGQVYTTQQTFGLSFLSMLRSSLVYYPLGILLLLFVIQRTWKYRKSITHVA